MEHVVCVIQNILIANFVTMSPVPNVLLLFIISKITLVIFARRNSATAFIVRPLHVLNV